MTTAVINFLKPPGMTSHDAVSFIRRTYRQKRVGHSGTLDPAAAGVLPVYLGNATRLVEYGDDFDKEYRTEILCGVTTDTGDDTGTVLIQKEVKLPPQIELEKTILSFLGRYEQVPPMYSALKINGRKLYELAREGIEVERSPRPVEIRSIRMLSTQGDRISMHVSCSKGTYIRTLCEDVGLRLGFPATMAFLLRTRVGPFDISQAFTPEEIAANPASALLSPDAAVAHFPVYRLNELETKLLKQGRVLALAGESLCIADNSAVRLYSNEDVFFGIGQIGINSRMLKPLKIFADGNG